MATEKEVYDRIKTLEGELKKLRQMADSAYSKKMRLSDFTWGEIAEIAKAHCSEEVFDIGDEKEIPLSSGEVLTAVIVGFNHDKRVDGSVVEITFGLKDIPDGWFEMNTDCTNVGGWKDCKMRNVYMQRFYNLFPKELKDLIVTVVKRTGNGGGKDNLFETEDKLFLFSEVEVFGTAKYSMGGEGTQYDYFKLKDNCIKHRDGYSSANSWWLRSPYYCGSDDFCYVTTSGCATYGYAYNSSGLSFGFCL